MKHLFIFITALFLSTLQAQKHELVIKINDIPEKYIGKNIYIGIWKSDGNFLNEEVIDFAEVQKITAKIFVFTKSFPEGSYAYSVYLDANDNNKLDKKMFGIPKEPYGFSNNFKPKFSAPKFNQCSFVLNKKLTQNIELNY